ncbi:hypothetical protein BpHYR1_023496 [Brachionus plicatilis]|uniref:Uncharacterized protein n=1 Tax=Brachionus plicatilis TaxID=10195 RepID=A0A3M7SEF7_BRAPC|nr:hypothetical protein BpHYR1_023496 [Brachionus plicatilis]
MKKQKQHFRKLLQQRLSAEQIQDVVNIEPRSLPTSSTLTSIASSTNELADTSAYTTGSIDSVHMIAELCNSILNIDCTQRSLSVLIYAILKYIHLPTKLGSLFCEKKGRNIKKTPNMGYHTWGTRIFFKKIISASKLGQIFH